jgi:GAF domain-containing protein
MEAVSLYRGHAQARSRSEQYQRTLRRRHVRAEPSIVAKLVPALQDLVIKRGPLTVPDAANAPELQPVREAIKALNIGSLLAVPLTDGSQQMGVIILALNASRTWPANDVVVIKTICDQVVIALNNAGLRRLVKNLSVTDEHSGLLKRASYLDLLMGETQRSLQQGVPLTVVLMQFGKAGAMLREFVSDRLSTLPCSKLDKFLRPTCGK